MKLPITLVIYATTKGHFGHRDIYKYTVEGLKKQIDLDVFEQKVVHIKNSGEEGLDEMTKFFKDNKFEVVVTDGAWKHFDSTHMSEYLKDIIYMAQGITTEYVLHLEDDWLFDPKNGEPLSYFLERAILELRTDQSILSLRFPHHFDDNNHLHGQECDSNLFAHRKLNRNNDLHSFNPNLMRGRDLFLTALIIKGNFDQLSSNCEVGFTQALKSFAVSQLPFAAFLPEEIRVRHLGIEHFDQIKQIL